MKIAFFGTYFYNFEKIIHNSKEAANLKEIYVFLDRKSYISLFKNVYCSYVDLNTKNLRKNNFSLKEIHSFFNCDEDRLTEFNIKKPTDFELIRSANLILNSFINWYEKIEPDILISEGKHNFFNRVIIDYLEKNNIINYSFKCGRIASSVYLEKSGKTIFNNIRIKEIRHSKDYMKKTHVNFRGIYHKLKNFSDSSLFRDLKSIICYFNFIAKEDKLLCYSGKRSEMIVKTRILYIKKRVLDYIFNIFNIRFNISYKDFLIYPEHYRPEASTSAFDYKYINDYKNCINLKANIKENIVFRFHPSYFTKRPFKQFLKIINVFKKGLSFPRESLKDLILSSRGVITVSSSVGIDSLILGKPLIILGNPEYIKSKKIFNNVLLIRSKYDYCKVPEYLAKYKKIDKNQLEMELKRLYHPFHVWSGSWIKVIIEDFKK